MANVLPVRIDVPPAPAALVSRSTVMAGYTKNGSQFSLAAETFDAGGGVYAQEIPLDAQFAVSVGLSVTVEFAADTSFPPLTVPKKFTQQEVQQSLPVGITFSLFLPNRVPHVFALAVNCPLAFSDADHLTIQWRYHKGPDAFVSRAVIVAGKDLPHDGQLNQPTQVYTAQFFRAPEFSATEKLLLQMSGRYRNTDFVAFSQELDLQPLYAFKVNFQFPNPSTLELVPLP